MNTHKQKRVVDPVKKEARRQARMEARISKMLSLLYNRPYYRADLQREMGVSQLTLYKVIRYAKEQGWVVSQGKYYINPDKVFVAGGKVVPRTEKNEAQMICIYCNHTKEEHAPNGCVPSCACPGFSEMTLAKLTARKRTLEANEGYKPGYDYSQDWLILAEMYERLEGRFPFYKYCIFKAAQYHPEIAAAETSGDDDDGHEYEWQKWSNK